MGGPLLVAKLLRGQLRRRTSGNRKEIHTRPAETESQIPKKKQTGDGLDPSLTEGECGLKSVQHAQRSTSIVLVGYLSTSIQ